MPRFASGHLAPLDSRSAVTYEGLPAKGRWLMGALRSGLPVPDGFVFGLSAEPPTATPAVFDAAVRALLAHGRVIVRSALVGEDEAHSSAAGLGLSVPQLDTLDAVRKAVETVSASRGDAALVAVRGALHMEGDGVVVQRQIERDVLIVGALLPSGIDYIETHGAQLDALAEGTTPEFSGLAERWEHAVSPNLQRVCGEIRSQLAGPPFGLDVELVADASGSVHVVQVRPLTRDLEVDGRTFLEAAKLAGHADRLRGQLVLDAEHNPEPLSAAHASLIAWLAAKRPGSGHPTTIAGWLYVRTKVRDLGKPSAAAMTPVQALERLAACWLPEARTRLDAVRAALVPDASQTAAQTTSRIVVALDAAQNAFLAMLDIYLRSLLPVRAAAGAALATRPEVPLSLDQRAGFADVLPTRWDIAAPSLAEHREFTAPSTVSELPTDATEAAVLLTEWDDHLFALGLAPLRRVYLAAAEALGLDNTAVFGLELDELRTALTQHTPSLRALAERRVHDRARWAALRPPARLDEGRPLPALPRRHLRGLGLGPDYTGPLAQRANLDALLEMPPGPEAIVVLPALTAQAALVLHELGVRAVCCAHGGALSHAALMIRELGLTGLIGAQGSTELPDGALATIETARGRIQIASSVTLGS